jgi:hypothetical protein
VNFASLDLPFSYGHGVWTQSVDVPAGDWGGAEDALTQAAQQWINDNPGKADGYHSFRDDANKKLTLDLMRGA